MIENQIKFIEIAKEWMHGCVMENIWIDLIRSIYAPYSRCIYLKGERAWWDVWVSGGGGISEGLGCMEFGWGGTKRANLSQWWDWQRRKAELSWGS